MLTCSRTDDPTQHDRSRAWTQERDGRQAWDDELTAFVQSRRLADPRPVSPFVRRALAGELPAKLLR